MKFFIVVLAAIAANLGLVNACAFSRQCCSDLTHEVHVMRDDIRGIGKNVAMLVSGRTAATRPNTATEATEATSITEASETTVPATTEAATVQEATEATSITEASETTVPATTEAATVQACPSNGIVVTSGDCFFPLLDQERTYPAAKQACNDIDSNPADIDNERTYNELILHLQQQVTKSGQSAAYIWLGMTFSPDMSEAYHSDGTEAAVQQWASTGYNSRLPFLTSQQLGYSKRTQLFLMIQPSKLYSSDHNGYVNGQPTSSKFVLCQRSV